jgi:hypothetical protein
LDAIDLAVLSDELRRAETPSGAVWRRVKTVWEPVAHKFLSQLHFSLAGFKVLHGIVSLRIEILLCTLERTIAPSTISFCHHTFPASFISVINIGTCFHRLWSSLYVIFPTINIFHGSRGLKTCIAAPQKIMLSLRALPFILIIFLLLLISSLSSEPHTHMTPRRLRRLQRNIQYHLSSSL